MKKFILYSIATFLLLLAVGAEFIANDDPILYEFNDQWHCGACKEWGSSTEHQTPGEAREIINPIVSFGANTLSPEGLYLQPPMTEEGQGVHWLGTDSQSRDVFAGLVYGTRYALLIGAISVLFALGVGFFLGASAAYYGNKRLRRPPAAWLSGMLLLVILIYLYFFHLLSLPLILVSVGLLLLLIYFWPAGRHNWSLPIDQWVTKGIELFDSLPALFVLLAWSATIDSWNIWNLSLLIAFFRWPTFARLIRAEMSRWANSSWIQSLRDLKMSDLWIIRTQLINLILVPISVHAAFSIAGAVSIEATLSFLGFGLGAEVQSWGRLLSDARQFFQAWWLVVFPGLLLVLFLWWTNQCAQQLQKLGEKSTR